MAQSVLVWLDGIAGRWRDRPHSRFTLKLTKRTDEGVRYTVRSELERDSVKVHSTRSMSTTRRSFARLGRPIITAKIGLMISN